MNKKDLIKIINKHTDLSVHASKIFIDHFIQIICSTLKNDEKVVLKDFGAFQTIKKRGKRYYDIPTGKIKTYPDKRTVKFVTYKNFKEQFIPKYRKINIRKEDDGSIGAEVTISSLRYTNAKPATGKKNVSQRVIRESRIETSDFIFNGQFLFNHFLGEEEHKKFPSIKVPHKDTPILLHHTDKIGATIGIMEPVLHEHLNNICEEIPEIKIIENAKLPILNRNYSYQPDFCLYWEKKKLYIDIEIDEPYDIVSRKPIHYIGNGDNLRDLYFIKNGWCVIRFAEQQIIDNIEGVTNYIKRVLRWLTDESAIKFHEDTLESIDRWSYEDSERMSLNNIREHYLNLPDYITLKKSDEDNEESSLQETYTFIKPAEDILLNFYTINNKRKWLDIINKIKISNCEHYIATRTNGYKWIYTSKTLKISSLNGQNIIVGQSPFGIDLKLSLDEIVEIIPLKGLFSNIHWENDYSTSLENMNFLKEILFDAIANGKPIWIAYNSNNSGYSTRFLSNICYGTMRAYPSMPHTELGYCKKYGMDSLSYFYAYCSNRKEFRIFAVDERIKELKVLNCDHVYFTNNEEYAKSFIHLIMSPYENNYFSSYFENADEILHIMPRNEYESTFVQGNLANLQVIKGKINEAIITYQQKPYNYFISPIATWGEMCIFYINYFINLCNKHINNNYGELDAKIIKHNFEEALKILTKSSWIQNPTK